MYQKGVSEGSYSAKGIILEKYPNAVCKKEIRGTVTCFAIYLTKEALKEQNAFCFDLRASDAWNKAMYNLDLNPIKFN